MAFSVASLTDYINQNSDELIKRLYFENKSQRYFGNVQTGVKLTEALQILTVTATQLADLGCLTTTSGSTAFTQRNITVGAIRYQDTLCPSDLRTKWTQRLLRTGANNEAESITFEQEIADRLVGLVKEHVELEDWQGDTASGNANLNKYDGLLKLIDAAGTAINGNTTSITSGTGITTGSTGNVVTIIENICFARTEALKTATDQVLFCGTDTFDKYTKTLRDLNLFNVDSSMWMNYEMPVVGYNVKLVGVPGLSGTNRLILGQEDNFVLGVDLENDFEEFKMWYSEDDDNLKYRLRFKRGVQVAKPSEIVQFKLV
jgi:hypothetical protein